MKTPERTLYALLLASMTLSLSACDPVSAEEAATTPEPVPSVLQQGPGEACASKFLGPDLVLYECSTTIGVCVVASNGAGTALECK